MAERHAAADLCSCGGSALPGVHARPRSALQRFAFRSERGTTVARCFLSRFTRPGVHALPRSARAAALHQRAAALSDRPIGLLERNLPDQAIDIVSPGGF